MFHLMLLCVYLSSQYTSLWSVSNSPLTPVSQNGGLNNCLGSQFLRGSSGHYPSLHHSATVPPSGSPMYDSSSVTEMQDTAQYEASPHGRLPSAWTPVTPPSLWLEYPRIDWNLLLRTLNLLLPYVGINFQAFLKHSFWLLWCILGCIFFSWNKVL